MLTDKIKGIVNGLSAYEFAALQKTVLAKKLEKLYATLTFPEADAWQISAEEVYKNARTWNTRYKELRRKYLGVIESFTKDGALFNAIKRSRHFEINR